MQNKLTLYNSLSGKKELFKPLQEGYIGMYVCGPTVYSDVHMGNVRTFVSFDMIYRFLKYLKFKVRYVRNITDVGHLVGDVDTGAEDKISKKARLEQLEPMEIVQTYTDGFHKVMNEYNALSPNIEPRATGHIIEQIEMVSEILKNGFAYEANGSVYFDTIKFAEDKGVYGKLSGKILDDLLVETRSDLKNQSDKKHPSDFAIWIKAAPEHIMRWNSPWSVGFPGWHLECSAMSTKYLGKQFDIHGGGNDLKFPHHENEIAQNHGCFDTSPSRYWLHTNMLLMNGRKMSKSENNSITPEELKTGKSEHVSKAYAEPIVRFLMMQTHYRSTLDITDKALLAAEKGYTRLMDAYNALLTLETSTENGTLDEELNGLTDQIITDLLDDFNTPRALASMYAIVPKINSFKEGKIDISGLGKETLQKIKTTFKDVIFDVMGLLNLTQSAGDDNKLEDVMDLVLQLRQQSREDKNWGISDLIRDKLSEAGITVKDGKDGAKWSIK